MKWHASPFSVAFAGVIEFLPLFHLLPMERKHSRLRDIPCGHKGTRTYSMLAWLRRSHTILSVCEGRSLAACGACSGNLFALRRPGQIWEATSRHGEKVPLSSLCSLALLTILSITVLFYYLAITICQRPLFLSLTIRTPKFKHHLKYVASPWRSLVGSVFTMATFLPRKNSCVIGLRDLLL